MAVAVGADFDARRRHGPQLLQAVGRKGVSPGQVVGKGLSPQHVLGRDEVGAGDAVLDQKRNGPLAVLGVSVVEGDADGGPAVGAEADPPLHLFEAD